MNRSAGLALVLSAAALITGARPSASLTVQSISERQVFGIALRSTAAHLLDEVEHLYGHKLIERVIANRDLPPATLGFADTSPEGAPIIAINPLIGRNEGNIVHELFHLKMQAEGFPLFDSPEAPAELRTDFDSLRIRIYDPMTHRIFFLQMRQMGLDPTSHIVHQYWDNKQSGIRPADDLLATYYYRLALEIEDRTVLADVETWYRANGWAEALSTGKGLVSIIDTANPLTPADMVKAFVECANLLRKGVVVFSFERMERRSYGSSTKAYAIIRAVQQH